MGWGGEDPLTHWYSFRAPQVSWRIEGLKAIASVISYLFYSSATLLECRDDGTLRVQADHLSIKIGNLNPSLGEALCEPPRPTGDTSLPVYRIFLVLMPFDFYGNPVTSMLLAHFTKWERQLPTQSLVESWSLFPILMMAPSHLEIHGGNPFLIKWTCC